MKRIATAALAALTLFGCSAVQSIIHRDNGNPYDKPFYARYLDPGNTLDQRIHATINGLRQNPKSPALHNELGMLLVQKGFPKDATVEFERAVNSDSRFYPAWYNLGLVRAAAGDRSGATRAFRRTVHLKPGHSAALFQLGLVEEQHRDIDDAIDYYAKAISINPALLDVKVNPRILDTKLIDLVLLRLYPKQHDRLALQFQPTPQGYTQKPTEGASPQPAGRDIVTPAAPVTDPGAQSAPPPPTPQ